MKKSIFFKLILVVLSLIGTVEARFGQTPEGWPCIQPYVAQVSAGAFWSGELLDNQSWQSDNVLTKTVEEASNRTISFPQSLAKIKIFLNQFEQNDYGEKRDKAALLVVALTDTINDKRTQILKGIDRFAKRQQMMITRIETQDKKLKKPLDNDDSANTPELTDLEARQKWDIRVFEEREQQKNYLCEQAVLLEQRFFLLGREIVAWLGNKE